MPGPLPKPTRIKEIEGNPGHQKLNKREPKATPGAPPMPAWLDAEGKGVWRRAIEELDSMGLLAQIDGWALAALCRNYSIAVKCAKVLKRRGMVMKIGAPPPKGEKDTRYEQQRPEFSMEQKAWSQFRMFCNLFGFSPAARARLMIDDELNEGKTPGKRAATLEDILSGPELPRPGQSIQ